jgi:hypothetical protein
MVFYAAVGQMMTIAVGIKKQKARALVDRSHSTAFPFSA